MKKKPAQQKVLDNLGDYTMEDIENLRGNQFPKWVRGALAELKQRELEIEARGGKTPEQVAAELAAQMIKLSLEDEGQ